MEEEQKIKDNLKYSVVDGAAHSVMLGFGESYLNLYAIALDATNMQIGFLNAVPKLVGSLSQLLSSRITEALKSRKKMITWGALLQSLVWIPILSLSLFSFYSSFIVWILIFFTTMYWIFGSIIVPPWSSMIGDIVPDKIKGEYFGMRNRIIGITMFVSMLIAGFLLHIFDNFNTLYGFTVIFFIALISKLISWKYLNKMQEPIYIITKESRFSFMDFVKKMNRTNYGLFVIYLSLMSFSVQIASPFFAVYMKKDLNLDYMTYTAIVGSAMVSNFLSISLWGKYSDRFGNKKILKLTGLMIPIIPFLWLLSDDVAYLVLIQAFAGFAWAGFNISSFNFILDTVSPAKRVRCVSYYNVLNGMGIFLGSVVGGMLMKIDTKLLSGFYLVLMVSGLFRLITSIIMLPKIREVRDIEKISGIRLMWSLLAAEPISTLKQIVVEIKHREIKLRRLAKTYGEKFFMNFINTTISITKYAIGKEGIPKLVKAIEDILEEGSKEVSKLFKKLSKES